jgi:hypothetical protein
MTTKFALIDPQNGTYSYFDSEQEVLQEFYVRMIRFAYPYFHNVPYSIVQINDDGNEIWSTPNGDPLENPVPPIKELEEARMIVEAILNEN